MHSLTVENYVKTIYQICGDGEAPSTTGQIAESLGVSPGTVTAMLKTLGEGGLATYTPYEGARLTAAGNALALRVLRRHRLVELFLVETLKLSWDEVHDEAENMEHAVSDRLVDRIEQFLDYPTTDPHGDPIPRNDGTIVDPSTRPLGQCAAGEQFELARVVDQSPEFLRYLADSGLTLGARGRVVSNEAASDVATVEVQGRRTSLSRAAADKVLVAHVAGQPRVDP